MVAALPLRKRLALELFRKFRFNSTALHQLDYIFWESTLRCNLKCLHCGSDCKKQSQVEDMPIKDFLRAIDEITPIVDPHKTMIVFTGGEPLLRKDLEVCGRQLFERGFPWGTVTNGLQLDATRLQSLILAGMRAVTVSLDGLEHSHNWLRGNPGSFKKTKAAIQLLAKISDLRFDVATCVHQRSFGELSELRDLLLSLGVKEWRIFTIFPIGRARENLELQLPPRQFRQLFDFIAAERKLGKMKVSYGCEGYLGEYEGLVRDNLFFCRAGVSVASVLANGSISACPNLRNNFIQGNIYRDNFREVWEKRYSSMRDRHWMQTGVCKDCSSFRYCGGNGLHLREEKTGELLFCHLHRLEEDRVC